MSAGDGDQPTVRVEIGTLCIEGLSRTFARRAVASFERALPAALAALPLPPVAPEGPVTVPSPGRLGPEAFGRRLAAALAGALRP